MKFRKKPIVVEAEQWFPDGRTVAGVVYHTEYGIPRFDEFDSGTETYPVVNTLEGRMRVSPGDWIITGVKGEKYPCKPDIFAATYEAVLP